ncbi:MAG: hypothetical protein HXY49_10190 [Ignavibacteriaceae bacterium]|nr:hypothetical protein [Ignavibacteriaceae bacterium]
MKKTISILLLTFIVYHSFGFLITHFILKEVYEEIAFSKIFQSDFEDKSELIAFKKDDLASGKLQFQRIDKKEFRYNGMMYDIIEEIETADSIFFHCINDKNEDHLFSVFSKHIEQNSDNKTTNNNTYKAISQLITEPPAFDDFSKNHFSCRIIRNNFKSEFNILNYPEVLTPPPRS